MGQRKAWSKEEDAALIEIIEVQKVKKWSAVSKKMETQFKIIGRTGKQCRERWHNQLDPNIKTQEWTKQEERILFELHNQFGNRWAKISQQLDGRTDNCVKNHFYSTLRRGFRKMNKYIVDNRHIQGLKQLKPVMLSKLVAAAEDKYDKKLKLSEEMVEKSIYLKNRLIPLSQQEESKPGDQQQIESLIKQIISFCRSYKRKKGKKAKKANEDYGQYYFQDCIDVSQDSFIENQKSNRNLAKQKAQNPHANLFKENIADIIKQQPLTLIKNKESVISVSLHKSRSKVIEQEMYETLNKRSSNISNLSAMFKLPSTQERRISNLSMSNQFNLDAFSGFDGNVLDSSFNFGVHKNLFAL